jgi:hypothetical protein
MSYQSIVAAESGLLHYWKMENPSGDDTDVVGGVEPIHGTPGGVTIGAAPSFPGGWTGLGSITCWSFAGATGGGYTNNNLPSLAVGALTVEFLANWTTNNNTDDHLLMELTPDFSVNNGFIIDGNPGGLTGDRFVGFALASGGSWTDQHAQPSAGTWHHHLYVFDRTNKVNKAYIDGSLQSLTANTHSAVTYGNFDTAVVYLMCRNITSLLGAGKMSQLAIYSGDKSSVAASHFAALSPGTTAPTADFTGTPLSGSSPLSVAFTDTSTNEGGSPTFHWEKNDGSGWQDFAGTPTAQNPTETFS